MVRVFLAAMLLFGLMHAHGGQHPVDHAASLRAALTKLDEAMRTGTTEARKDALLRILPAKADMQVLFPEHADKLWPRMEPHHKAMLAHVDEVATELTRDQWVEIEAIDVRRKDDPGRYKAVLKMLPKDIPVFRVVKRGKRHTTGSGSYLYVRKHWVFLRGLEGVPRGIEMLKAEERQRQPGEK
jgi:hypothetical protein